MKPLKSTRYYTMNSWNKSTAPAYNLKVYNVIDDELQDKVLQLLDSDELWKEIDQFMTDFACSYDYQWQAGINGRSGGYLVLYKGGIHSNKIYCSPGKTIADDEVPVNVLKAFRQLAINIVKATENLARRQK